MAPRSPDSSRIGRQLSRTPTGKLSSYSRREVRHASVVPTVGSENFQALPSLPERNKNLEIEREECHFWRGH